MKGNYSSPIRAQFSTEDGVVHVHSTAFEGLLFPLYVAQLHALATRCATHVEPSAVHPTACPTRTRSLCSWFSPTMCLVPPGTCHKQILPVTAIGLPPELQRAVQGSSDGFDQRAPEDVPVRDAVGCCRCRARSRRCCYCFCRRRRHCIVRCINSCL